MNDLNDLEETANLVKRYRVKLAYSQSGYAILAFKHPALPAYIRLAIRNHRRGLARMMADGDWRLCPAPDLHRSSWFYAGQGRYICNACQRIDEHQLKFWHKAG